jgi:aryl-alcohol dehydrogenase-like predicted oxidoreductase
MSLLVLRQAFKQGVTYWDTANTYMGGGQVNTDSDTELKLAGRFLQKGFKASRVQGLK